MEYEMASFMGQFKEKKLKERVWVEAFLSKISLKYEELEEGPEPPDFVLKLTDGTEIGLEVTEHFSGNKTSGGHTNKIFEEKWKKIQNLISANKKDYPELEYIVALTSIKNKDLPSKNEQSIFVDELIDFARSKLGEIVEGDHKEYNENDCSHYPQLKKYIRKICIFKSRVSWRSWNCMEVKGGSIGLTKNELYQDIEDKCKVSENYSKGFRAHWLLIVADGVSLSQIVGATPWLIENDIKEIVKEPTILDLFKKSSFSKVFFFYDASFNGEVIQVYP